MALLTPGMSVRVEVPATSANLGPGFDCLGLALDWRDRVDLEVSETDATEITGEGAGSLPTGAEHLVLASARQALARCGHQAAGLTVRAHNTIPHGRGLGSSSAAIAAGVVGAAALVARERGSAAPDPADWLELATAIEGHPDNVAAALLGGLVLAYPPVVGRPSVAAVRMPICPEVRAMAFVPARPVSTHQARGLLPTRVPHGDAAANAARSALLVHALGRDPSLLFEATVDRLHQDYRAVAMPESAELVRSLRSKGSAAMISGAGPTVLVLGTAEDLARVEGLAPDGFWVSALAVGPGATLLDPAT